MTWKDEIVEEVRKVRADHAAKFEYDISAICADIRRKQANSGREIVDLTNRKNEAAKDNLLKSA